MDLANLTDVEVRAVMALGRLRHERRHYAQAVVEVETAAEALPAAERAKVAAEVVKEPLMQAGVLAEARASEAKRKAEALRMATAQAEAKVRKVGNPPYDDTVQPPMKG